MRRSAMLQTLLRLSFLANLFFSSSLFAQNIWITPFEKSQGKASAAYQEAISFYLKLAQKFPRFIKVKTYGVTDAGKPLHLVILSGASLFSAQEAQKKDMRVFLVNNAIHPGEPDGVDASMLFARDWCLNPAMRNELSRCVVLIIPFYNIEGALNRGCCSRANQNGPEAYGFRGNGQNLDLNRDFIKCDSRNARAFVQIFQEWRPDFFADNHTTNGADYAYTMTLIASQHNKLGDKLGPYLKKELLPQIYEAMEKAGQPICPYVYTRGPTPETGIIDFLDSPRYSTGYSTLFQTFGFVPETHMLKPFKERVEATYTLMRCMAQVLNRNAEKIKAVRAEAQKNIIVQKEFPIAWALDTTKPKTWKFKGYSAEYRTSKVTGAPRLYYNRSLPYEKEIPFYDEYHSVQTKTKPVAYIIPQAWHRVIDLLKINGVQLHRLTQDATLNVETYYIDKYKTLSAPYEHHYLHYQVTTQKKMQLIQYRAGDYVIYMNQPANRYILETLEPEAEDSFFCWNFFDSILQQKEYYSDYVFEELADSLLTATPGLKEAFEKEKAEKKEFRENAQAQLNFIYYRSPYYEKEHNRYPVVRLLQDTSLPVALTQE